MPKTVKKRLWGNNRMLKACDNRSVFETRCNEYPTFSSALQPSEYDYKVADISQGLLHYASYVIIVPWKWEIGTVIKVILNAPVLLRRDTRNSTRTMQSGNGAQVIADWSCHRLGKIGHVNDVL